MSKSVHMVIGAQVYLFVMGLRLWDTADNEIASIHNKVIPTCGGCQFMNTTEIFKIRRGETLLE